MDNIVGKIEPDHPVFTTKSIQSNSIIYYLGVLGNLSKDTRIETVNISEIQKYLHYLEILYEITFSKYYILTSDELLIFDRNDEKIISIFDLGKVKSPFLRYSEIQIQFPRIRKIIKKEYLKALGSLTSYIKLVDYYQFGLILNSEPNIILFLRNILEKPLTSSKNFEKILKIKTNSHVILRLFKFLIEEKLIENKSNFYYKFQLIKELGTSSTLFLRFFDYCIELLSENKSDLSGLQKFIPQVNYILFDYLFLNKLDAEIDQADIHYLVQLSLSYHLKIINENIHIANLLNNYQTMLISLNNVSLSKYYLVLSVRICHAMIEKCLVLNKKIGFDISKLYPILNNYFSQINNTEISKEMRDFISVLNIEPENLTYSLKSFSSYLSDKRYDNWNKYLILELSISYQLATYLLKISNFQSDEKSRKFDTIMHKFAIDISKQTHILLLFHILYRIFDFTLSYTSLNPTYFFSDINLMDKLTDLRDRLNKSDNDNLMVAYSEHRRSFKTLELNYKFQKIIFSNDPDGVKIKKLIDFYTTPKSQIILQYSQSIKRERTLFFVVSVLDTVDPNLILQFLDILEINSVPEMDLSKALINLIRSHLTGDPVDDATRYYISKYLDYPFDDDFHSVNKDILEDLSEKILSSSDTSYSISMDDLLLEMKQEVSQEEDSEPENLEQPAEIPLEIFNLLASDDLIDDYMIYFVAYKQARSKLEEGNDNKDLFYDLTNVNPYEKNLVKYAEELAEIRQDNPHVVDPVKMELLKIRILGPHMPVESLARLDRFYQKLSDVSTYNPTLADMREICKLYHYLYSLIQLDNIPKNIALLEDQLDMYEKEFQNHLSMRSFREINGVFSTEQFKALSEDIDMIELFWYLAQDKEAEVETEEVREFHDPVVSVFSELHTIWDDAEVPVEKLLNYLEKLQKYSNRKNQIFLSQVSMENEKIFSPLDIKLKIIELQPVGQSELIYEVYNEISNGGRDEFQIPNFYLHAIKSQILRYFCHFYNYANKQDNEQSEEDKKLEENEENMQQISEIPSEYLTEFATDLIYNELSQLSEDLHTRYHFILRRYLDVALFINDPKVAEQIQNLDVWKEQRKQEKQDNQQELDDINDNLDAISSNFITTTTADLRHPHQALSDLFVVEEDAILEDFIED